ncbi:hypothetical protein vseg_016471 [Gypsophila vaccaria]
MASKALVSAVTMGSSSSSTNNNTLVRPMPVKPQGATPKGQRSKGVGFKVEASLKEKTQAVSGLTAAGVTAAMMVPQVAEAAELVPSLNNFLFSILAGGAVLTAIFGAVIAVSNFDPVKRA